MEEAEYLCDQIAIINNGKIIAFDTPKRLKQKYGCVKMIEIKLKDATAQSVCYLVKSVAGDTMQHTEILDTNTVRIGSVEAEEILVKRIESFSNNGVLSLLQA